MSNAIMMTSSHQRRIVSVDDRPVFEILWHTRNGPGTEASRLHGVSDESLIDEYASALQRHFSLLTGPLFGWVEPETSHRQPYSVIIGDLGPWILGTATTDGRQLPYLAFSCRNPTTVQEASARKCSDVVLHELVHLFQFQTETWRYWPNRNRWGTNDPNWWLHEATALAIEAEQTADVSWYPWLWTWATQPQLSLESDATGAMAAPFIQYLMRRFGQNFAATIYRVAESAAPTMRGTELLDAAIRVRRTNLPNNDRSELPDFFLDFCIEAIAPCKDRKLLDASITRVVGQRLMTAHVSQFPFEFSNLDTTIDHLGCRYFEIGRPSNGKHLRLELIIPHINEKSVMNAAVLELDASGNHLRKSLLKPDLRNGSLSLVLNPHEHTRSSIVAIVNTAYGSGWKHCDGLPFKLRMVPEG